MVPSSYGHDPGLSSTIFADRWQDRGADNAHYDTQQTAGFATGIALSLARAAPVRWAISLIAVAAPRCPSWNTAGTTPDWLRIVAGLSQRLGPSPLSQEL